MRQLAWLHAVPGAPDGSKGKADDRTRLQRLHDEDVQPDMPEVSCRYLLDFLLEVGPGMPGAVGMVALTFGELESWQRAIGVRLSPWEARALRSLSSEYVREHHAASDARAEAPWRDGEVDPQASLVAHDLRDEMRRMAK